MVKFDEFIVGVVRSVIGHDGVNQTAFKRLSDRLHVALGAKRRRHFKIRIVSHQLALVEGEMMRRSLAGDADTLALSLLYEL